MTARELRVGDRVTIGKGRTRYTIAAIIRGAHYEATVDGEVAYSHKTTAVLVRNARTYWRGNARGRGRRVPLAKLSRVKR